MYGNSLVKLALSLCLPLALSTACNRPSGGSEVPITPADQAEADSVFTARCATCHGAQGIGDGPAGLALNPKPRNFHDKMWQSNVTDRHIDTIIVGGGVMVGKSPTMLANPDLASKPGVVAALRNHVRSFGK
jgi:mono/diheme cytochrome c family protein